MTEFTFRQAVGAIQIATHPARPFPRALRDNHPISRLLVLDWRTVADRDAWLDYFGAHTAGDDPGGCAWSNGWHGWTVLMTAHFPSDIDPTAVGIEQRTPPAAVARLAEGEATAKHLWRDGDACIEASARRIHGLHRAEDLDRLPTAAAVLCPDATIEMPTVATQPLPPGTSGWAVAPDVHTGLPEPERDDWYEPTPAWVTR